MKLSRRQWMRVRLPIVFAALLAAALGFVLRPPAPTAGDDATGEAARLLLTPVDWIDDRAQQAGEGLRALTSETAPEDAARLREEVARLEAELTLARAEVERWRLGEETGRAAQTADFPPEFRFVAADVIGSDPSPRRHSVVINRGRRHGIAPDMPVVSDVGLVGIVRRVGELRATVQLATDPYFAVAARAADGRWTAIARGQGAGRPLQVEPTRPLERLPEGERLVTRGEAASLYPPGIPIGALAAGGSDKFGLREIECAPSALAGELEFVLVVVRSD